MSDVEVLLQQSVKHLGLVGDVVKVKPGFARNYLFPKKLGVPASEDAKRQIARRAAKVREAEEIRLKEVAELVSKLEAIELKVTMKADPNGNLYGSVNAARIVELAAEEGATLTEKDIRLDAPIKTVGEHKVKVHVRDDDYGQISLNVESEGGPIKEVVMDIDDEEGGDRHSGDDFPSEASGDA